MRTLVSFPIAELRPEVGEVLRAQELPAEDALAPRIRRLLDDAFADYLALVEPRAVYAEVTPSDFAALLAPLALPSDGCVVGRVSAQAEGLALYVATLGPVLSRRIRQLFEQDALAEGYMLDAVASAGADLLSVRLAACFARARAGRGASVDARTLAYSPGYCGWPTSGQRPLFAALAPDEIGVSLNESCLMTPLKSVSGVLVSEAVAAHRFRPDFSFCGACRSRDCGGRMASLLGPPPNAAAGAQ